jgi:hypothetical protein
MSLFLSLKAIDVFIFWGVWGVDGGGCLVDVDVDGVV